MASIPSVVAGEIEVLSECVGLLATRLGQSGRAITATKQLSLVAFIFKWNKYWRDVFLFIRHPVAALP
jgi:hypothetical protein